MILGRSQMLKEGTTEALQTFTLPYREPNGSLFGFQNGTMTHCILYPQHIHMDNNISSNGYMRGRYFKTILILIVMYICKSCKRCEYS